jgi:hypothetical protein
MSGRDNRHRGTLHDDIEKAFEAAGEDVENPFFTDFADAGEFVRTKGDYEMHEKPGCYPNVWLESPGSSDTGDPRDSSVKPKIDNAWTRVPVGDAEKAIYYGKHVHTESNPLGLHSHVIGGELTGGHTHGPQNRLGVHTHTEIRTLDGQHTHMYNMPDGGHDHCPENFG